MRFASPDVSWSGSFGSSVVRAGSVARLRIAAELRRAVVSAELRGILAGEVIGSHACDLEVKDTRRCRSVELSLPVPEDALPSFASCGAMACSSPAMPSWRT